MSFTGAYEQEKIAQRWRRDRREQYRKELQRLTDEIVKAVYYGKKAEADRLLAEQRFIYARAQEVQRELPPMAV